VWYQGNSSHAWRRWYALDANNVDGASPYIRPSNPLFTQYAAEMRVDTLQMHLQDSWQLFPTLLVEAGFKTSAQYANGWFTVQPAAGSLAGASTALPSGRINTEKWFLPTVGAKWEATGNEQVYFNIQKNQRQYQAYGGGGSADPWSTSSQAAFDYIKATASPKARGPMKWACAATTISPARCSPASRRRSTITTSISATACWRSARRRAALRAARSRAAPPRCSTWALSPPTAWMRPSRCISPAFLDL
jgi:hypothetical protein